MSADTAELAALTERVDVLTAKLADLFALMRTAAAAAGVYVPPEPRPDHLHLIEGGRR